MAHLFLPMQNFREMETEEIHCKKCQKTLGKLAFDGAVLVIANAEFYANCRFSCSGCGCPKTFFPKVPTDISGFDGETKKILNGLGLNRKYEDLKEKRRKKGN
jgi:hypothetical protein